MTPENDVNGTFAEAFLLMPQRVTRSIDGHPEAIPWRTAGAECRDREMLLNERTGTQVKDLVRENRPIARAVVQICAERPYHAADHIQRFRHVFSVQQLSRRRKHWQHAYDKCRTGRARHVCAPRQRVLREDASIRSVEHNSRKVGPCR